MTEDAALLLYERQAREQRPQGAGTGAAVASGVQGDMLRVISSRRNNPMFATGHAGVVFTVQPLVGHDYQELATAQTGADSAYASPQDARQDSTHSTEM